jgi:phosphoglycerate dehydrogenase-like enzyme
LSTVDRSASSRGREVVPAAADYELSRVSITGGERQIGCMKITVIGATGLIGSKVVDLLKENGHDVVAASRAPGADVLTGEGLADALAAADVLVVVDEDELAQRRDRCVARS